MKTVALFFLISFGPLLSVAEPSGECNRIITPIEAIEQAAANERGISGTFELLVQSTGAVDGTVMLYSELDAHDPHCLSIALSPAAVKEMFRQSKLEPIVDLKGKKIRVSGQAMVEKIFGENQTHVWVSNPKNVVVVK